jgi:hypothetical protein
VVTIEAAASIVEGKLDASRVAAYLAKYDEPIRTQLNTTPEQLQAQFGTTLRLVPSRVRSW